MLWDVCTFIILLFAALLQIFFSSMYSKSVVVSFSYEFRVFALKNFKSLLLLLDKSDTKTAHKRCLLGRRRRQRRRQNRSFNRALLTFVWFLHFSSASLPSLLLYIVQICLRGAFVFSFRLSVWRFEFDQKSISWRERRRRRDDPQRTAGEIRRRLR